MIEVHVVTQAREIGTIVKFKITKVTLADPDKSFVIRGNNGKGVGQGFRAPTGVLSYQLILPIPHLVRSKTDLPGKIIGWIEPFFVSFNLIFKFLIVESGLGVNRLPVIRAEEGINCNPDLWFKAGRWGGVIGELQIFCFGFYCQG